MYDNKSLRDYFDNTWTLTESLFTCVSDERGFYEPPPHGLRHPLIFYYGHPSALYINKLRVAGLLEAPVNAYFEKVFETGVDEMSWDDLSNNGVPWPSLAEVHQYRKQVYEVIVNLINKLGKDKPNISSSSPLWALVMSFEHERIHLETSSVLINEMPLRFLQKPMYFPKYHSSLNLKSSAEWKDPVPGVHFPINELIEMDSSTVAIGKKTDYPSFGWDNEYGERTFSVPKFRASKFKISNGDYYEFVKSGGYANPDYWTDVGWKWRAFRNAKWATHWVPDGPQGLHKFNLRLMFDIVPMQWAWPVTINFHEASAFCKWKGEKLGINARVITEVEHHVIRDAPVNKELNGEQVPLDPIVFDSDNLAEVSNTNATSASPSPVDHYPPNSKGFYDVNGNMWEWCSDYFSPLHGFEVHRLYEDFSTPCFDGLHNVLMGSSFMSTGNEVSIYSRFHFRPHFLQHSTCRLVEQLGPEMVTSDTDARSPYVGSYPFRRSKEGTKMEALAIKEMQHSVDILKYFGQVCVRNYFDQSSLVSEIKKIAVSNGIVIETSNLIEVGCGAGNLSLTLANSFRSVLGIDHNGDHIDIANSVLKGTLSTYVLPREGEIVDTHKINVTADCSKRGIIDFRQADAMSLPAELQNFDVVFLNDVIDKVSSPNSILSRLGGERGLVKPGGMLLITSAFQWKETVTPKSLWIGGYIHEETGTQVKSIDSLIEKLSEDFKHVSSDKIPIIWNESSRDVRGKVYDIIGFVRKA